MFFDYLTHLENFRQSYIPLSSFQDTQCSFWKQGGAWFVIPFSSHIIRLFCRNFKVTKSLKPKAIKCSDLFYLSFSIMFTIQRASNLNPLHSSSSQYKTFNFLSQNLVMSDDLFWRILYFVYCEERDCGSVLWRAKFRT